MLRALQPTVIKTLRHHMPRPCPAGTRRLQYTIRVRLFRRQWEKVCFCEVQTGWKGLELERSQLVTAGAVPWWLELLLRVKCLMKQVRCQCRFRVPEVDIGRFSYFGITLENAYTLLQPRVWSMHLVIICGVWVLPKSLLPVI